MHLEVEGLDPDRKYVYRLKAGAELSPVGRTLTAPPANADVAHLAFALVSCQSCPAGFHPAYRHMAEEDVAFVAHLGDYIYEGDAQGTRATSTCARRTRAIVRRHLGRP